MPMNADSRLSDWALRNMIVEENLRNALSRHSRINRVKIKVGPNIRVFWMDSLTGADNA